MKVRKLKKKKASKKVTAETICPGCGKEVETHKCRFCGATKCISSVTGQVIWMRNGRVVEAFQDEKNAYIEMAKRYGIDESRWPERFRKEEVSNDSE